MRNFFLKLVGKINRFFRGRNGFDDLAKLSIILSIVVFIIYGFWPRGIVKYILSFVYLALLVYAYFRILSKKVYKRSNENKKYVNTIKMIKTRWKQRKTHKFYRCPKCKTWLRVPKGRGKITITCVKCSTKFDKKT